MQKLATITLIPEEIIKELEVILQEGRPGRAWVPVLKDIPKDRKISRQLALADKLGRKIRLFAANANIELNGKQWVDPAPFQHHARRLTSLFNSMSYSPAYAAWQENNRKALVETLAENPDFIKGAMLWPLLDDSDRMALVREVSELHHQTYRDGLYVPPEIELEFYRAARKGLDDEHYVRGSFMAQVDRDSMRPTWSICFNTHPDTGFGNFLTAMNYTHHENTHAVQDALGRLNGRDEIDPGHPLSGDALYWHEARVHRHCYLSTIRPIYYNHPQEKDAFKQGNLFAAEVKQALDEKGLTLPAPPPFP